jgi:hypothetical protein
MKGIVILFAFIVMALQSFAQKPDSVYRCMGPKSKVYHKTEYCKGLSHCSTKLKKVSLDDAINIYHRRLCGYEK